MKKSLLLEIICFSFMVLFFYTGITKLLDHSTFEFQLSESPVLTSIAPVIAWALPLFEIIVVILLLMPRWRTKGLYSSLFLMLLFTCYVIILVETSDQLPCSCGGILEQLSWKQHIIFNILFTSLAILGVKLNNAHTKKVTASLTI